MVSEREEHSDGQLRVLVVCAGNTCRSPAAAAAIRLSAQRRGIPLEVSSAGTTVNDGTPVVETMRKVAAKNGMVISGRARQVSRRDMERADIVLALDRSVADDLKAITCNPQPVIRLLGGYGTPEADPEITDPWGGTERDYARTLEHIMVAADRFAASLTD